MSQKLEAGDLVQFVDKNQERHNALVVWVHPGDLVNLVYIRKTKRDEDDFGNARILETSVPHWSPEMHSCKDGFFWV